MLKKIKNYLSNKKVTLIFFSFLILVVLLFPLKKAEAIIGTGIFDYFSTALGGIEEKAGPMSTKIISIFLTAVVGIIFLYISASLLQWIIYNPEWLTLKNPVVESGLYFITGLVNLFIILIFIIIAIAYILKIETFAAKKALPKLIIVALLINFVPVFIGILIDVATILHRTILGAVGGDIVFTSLEAILGGIEQVISGIAGWIAFLAGVYLIPFVSPFAQYGFVIFIVTGTLFFPAFLSWLVQIFLAFLLGALFITLAFIFALRIFAIWFLVMIAPLAFLCMVLPQTEKYWKEWLHHLFSWVFFGILVLLFLVLGLRGAQYLYPAGAPPTYPLIGWLSLPSYFYYYFFLFVFIALVTWLSQKTAPQFASFVISQATMLSGRVAARLKPVGKAGARAAREQAAAQRRKEEEVKERKKKGEALKFRERLALGAGKVMAAPVRFAERMRGTTPEAELRKDILKEASKFKDKFKEDIEGLVTLLPDLTAETRVSATLALKELKGDKALKKISDDRFAGVLKTTDRLHPKKLGDLLTQAQLKRVESLAETDEALAGVLRRWAEDEDVQPVIKDRTKIEGVEASELWRGTEADREKVRKEARLRKAFSNMKVEDYENMTSEMGAEKEFLEGAARYIKSRAAIRRMIEKGILEWDRLNTTVQGLGLKEVAKTNPIVLSFPYTPGGRALGLTTYPNLIPRDRPQTDREARRRIDEMVSEFRRREALTYEQARRIVEGVPPPPGVPPTTPPPGRPGPGPAPGAPPRRPGGRPPPGPAPGRPLRRPPGRP